MLNKITYLDCAKEMLGHALDDLADYIEDVVLSTEDFIKNRVAYNYCAIGNNKDLDQYFCKLLKERDQPLLYLEKAYSILGKYYLDVNKRAHLYVISKKVTPTANELIKDFLKVQQLQFQLTNYYEPLYKLIDYSGGFDEDTISEVF